MDWNFVNDMLVALGFPARFIKILMTYLTSTRYSLLVNGSPMEAFPARRGLQQGDLISPLIFVLGMEYLSRVLNTNCNSSSFHYHSRCKTIKLNHLCFADDLILFGRADRESIKVLFDSLKIFSETSGLVANSEKSTMYLAGVCPRLHDQLTQYFLFPTGKLPFKYLGVPLSSKRIFGVDCDILVDKMTSRIRSWQAKFLSYAARLQLVNSVLMSISSYWCQIFIIPLCVIKQINVVCRAFLWHGDSYNTKPGNVRWSEVCRPKSEGGLGIRNLGTWNEAAVGKIAWHIYSLHESLWVKWIHDVNRKGGN